jgi:asparagine synthase (glutamine-hydrolysing)
MCGIAGIVSQKRIDDLQIRIHAATIALTNRGPEYEQYWHHQNNHIAFGHKRLCIIDVDQRSNQPFSYLNRYQIIHNGELYNYLEIKEELQKKRLSI